MNIQRKQLLSLSIALAGVFALFVGCNQDRAADPVQPPADSWRVAPRIFAGDLTEDELSTASWVRAVATREGDVVAVAETSFSARSLELTIPNAGSVTVTVSGYDDKNRTTLLWSGSNKVETGNAKPVITIAKGPGLLPVPTPRFSSGEGIFRKATKVAILADSSNLEFRYTTDGGDPSSSSPKYLDSILVDRTMTLRAISTRKGRAASAIASVRYELKQDTVDAPEFSVEGGSHDKVLTAAITCDTAGAEIRYTTDGSDPIATSIKYTAPIEVSSSKTLRAVAFKKDLVPSPIASVSYEISLKKVKTPEFTPEPGSFDSATSVEIKSDSGAEIRYTLDGSEPTASSPSYKGALKIERTTTLKAIATMKGRLESSMMTGKYSIAGTVAPPEFKPAGGTFRVAQKVVLVADTGTTVRWTADTTAPLANWSVYSGPIDVAASQVLKAYASRNGKNSATARAAFVIRPDTLPAPRFDTAAGTYSVGQKVTISCDTSGASIHYTLDGSEPNAGSTRYSGAIELQTTTTIRAKAYKTGFVQSEIVSATYVIIARGAMAAPEFSPEGGEFDTAQTVTITSDSAGASIHYTTDGSEPTDKSAKYTGPISVASSQTLRAVAIKEGRPNSAVSVASFSIVEAGRVETPKILPEGGVFTAAQSVELVTNTESASIRYTLDGSEPTASSRLYENSFVLDSSKVVKAIAFKDGLKASAVAIASFTINIKAPDTALAPEISPKGGTFTNSAKVTIVSKTAGANIYYTLDSTEPSTSSMIYTDTIVLEGSATVRAIAGGNGLVASKVVEAKFTVTRIDTVLAPAFDKDSGTFRTALKVALSSGTQGSVIHYTLDGKAPTSSSTKYVDSIAVDSSMTITAFAIRDGMAPSPVVEHAYRILKKVEMPVLSVEPGTYAPPKTIAISCATVGATIYYTLDGTDPTTASNKYEKEITLNVSGTLRAIAVADGMVESDIAEAKYALQEIGSVASPEFSPFGGTFTTSQSVKITSATEGATIHYTTDGTAPTTASPVYSSPLTISANTTLKALAVASGLNNSAVTSASFVFQQQVATPTFSPTAGTFSSAQAVSITTPTSGASIYYTLDGSTPTASSKLYQGSILVSQTTTVKAIAVAQGMANSSVGSATYTIQLPVATPIFSIKSGTYGAVQNVAITSATTDATIYYTLDGTTPTSASNKYQAPIPVSKTTTINAIAIRSGLPNSSVATAAYTIDFPDLAAPTITPATYTFNNTPSVSITSATTGAKIYYTTDGTTPTTSSLLYSKAFTVSVTTTVKAIAVMDGWDNSPVGSSTITLQCYTPKFSLLGSRDTTYKMVQSLTLTSPTAGATIYYTIDGSIPSSRNGRMYDGAITVSYTQTVRAVAVKAGWSSSPVGTLEIAVQPKSGLLAPSPVTFSPVSGSTVLSGTSVKLASETIGAVIHYTTDWTEPTETSPIYKTGIEVKSPGPITIKARAYANGFSSIVSGASYAIK